ncbi:MAG: T9SS type A sorting domain-containing protein [Hymenobacter sp.]
MVYNGTGHSVVVTGLQPNTTYCIADAEYNTDGTTILYNIRSSSLRLSTPAAPRSTVAAPTPLPVTLTSFTGVVDTRNFATLRWTTASEQNSNYFALERSPDGASFAEVGQVAARGSSNQPAAYTWSDPQPLAYATYYRLRQADHDGSSRYSSVVTLAPRLARSIEVYPSPSAGQTVQVRLQGFDRETLTLNIADALGQQVLNQTITPSTTSYQVPLPTGLATGTYFLTLNGNGIPLQKRLVVSE